MDNTASTSTLAGMDIVLTRPAGSAVALSARWRAEGARCLNIPLISIRPRADDAALQIALADAERADALVFASPNAARCCLRLRADFRPHGRIFAQGPATAAVLHRHGLAASVPARGFTTEDLLHDDFFADVAGKRVLRLAGTGGRDLLLRSLRERGADAEAIALYRRVPARLDRRHHDALAAMPDPVVLISSAESLALLPPALGVAVWTRLRHCRVLVSSPRLHLAAREAGFQRIHDAASAASADLRAGLAELAEASRGR